MNRTHTAVANGINHELASDRAKEAIEFKVPQLAHLTVIDLRNLLDSMIREGRAQAPVAIVHNGSGHDITKITWHKEVGALVLISVDQDQN